MQFTDFSHNTLQTPCHHVQCTNDNATCCKYRSACSFKLQKKRKRCQFQKAANAMRFANDSYKALQAPCVALSFTQYAVHTVQVIVFGFGMLQAFYSVRFFCFRPLKKTQQACHIRFQILQTSCSLQMLVLHCRKNIARWQSSAQ
jgi:hypothetical protein